jgi:uncharacterized protein YciI
MERRSNVRLARNFAAVLAAASLAACRASATAGTAEPTTIRGSTTMTMPSTAPKPLYALQYVAGPAWRHGQPPDQQDLAGHFGYVDDLFKQGRLIVNGLYGDEVRGLYVFSAASEAEVRAIIAADPGVKNGVLTVETVTSWIVLWDGLDAPETPRVSYFLLEYGPGQSWAQGRSPMEQDLSAHFAYVASKQKEGLVLAAGPIGGTEHGRYLVAAPSKDGVDAYVAADPGVRSGVLALVSARPWTPLHRQTQAQALHTRGGK